MRSAEDHGGAAFATSFTSSQPLCRSLLQIEEEDPATLPLDLLTSLSNHMGEENVLESESFVGVSQRAISTKIDLNNKQKGQ